MLNLFRGDPTEARRRYFKFVGKGVPEGRRNDLTGGGLGRSVGGWSALKSISRGENRMKGDERILGRGDLVESVLKVAPSTASECLTRGWKIVEEKGLELLDEGIESE